MRVSTLRRVDRWIGVPICVALTLAHRWLRRSRPVPDGPGRSILFVKLTEQGSTVLAASAMRRAIEMVGRENVFFLCFEENRFILDVMDLIPAENVVTIDARGTFGTLLGSLRAVRRLRRRGIDTAIDMEFFARSSAILAFLSGASRRIGFHGQRHEGAYRGDLMTHRLRCNLRLHASTLLRTMVEAIHAPAARFPAHDWVPVDAPEAPPAFVPAPEEVEAVRRMLRDASGGADRGPLVLLNPNCGDLMPLRAWPQERYVELARRILAGYPSTRIAFTGKPSEAEATGDIVRRVGDPRCYCLAGRTTVRDLLVTYTLAEVLVTNDSGPAHFAALTPIDVVTLFGPESPHLFGVRAPRSHVVWRGIACSPCVSAFNDRTSPCKDNVCMSGISVDDVWREVAPILDVRLAAARG